MENKSKFTYESFTDKHGNEFRYRCWMQTFKDEGTGKCIAIKRRKAIKINGTKVRFYNNAELKRMSPSQRAAIKIPRNE